MLRFETEGFCVLECLKHLSHNSLLSVKEDVPDVDEVS
jgi:hypothetical protein